MLSWKENFKKRKCWRDGVMLGTEWGAGCSQRDLVKKVGKPRMLGCIQHGCVCPGPAKIIVRQSPYPGGL